MSIKRGYWWGKLSGLLAGGMGGSLGLALSIFVDALLNGRLLTESEWFWQMIVMGIVGLFCGAILGAILGTVLGVLIAWAQLDELAPGIWTCTGATAGLLISLVPHELYSLLSPIVWVWVGGLVGWSSGRLFLHGARSAGKKTAVPPQSEPA